MASSSLELVSFNARSLENEKKRKKVFNILKKQTSMNSVIFLQECHSTKEVETLWEYQWKNKIFYSHGKSNARGVCMLLRPGLEYKLISPEIKDKLGRYLILHMEIQDLPYVLVNYHAPNDEQGQLYTLNEISDKLKTLSVDEDTRLIWGGDWNCILDKSLDAMGGSPLICNLIFLVVAFMPQFKVITPQFLLIFPHSRRLLEGQATGNLIVPLSMTLLLLKRQKKLFMRLQ